MKIIISPAKQMKVNNDFMQAISLPVMLDRTERILHQMKKYDRAELKKLFRANDKITEENFQRYQDMDLRKGLTPAVLSYSGLAYNNMAPQVFTDRQWQYVKNNLKILSGFYGILNAADGVVPYRLEMQTKVGIDGAKDLYDFWRDSLYRTIADEVRADVSEGMEAIILNLASKEYSQVVEPFVEADIRFVTCVFAEYSGKKLVTKGTKAKMARGQMVAFLAEEQAQDLDTVKEFSGMGFRYSAEHSTDKELVFVQEQVSD
ncbi:MAG: peroxide stress protein YaaA [Bariatricus sp.]